MAYMKFKELTQYIYFNNKTDNENIPKYVYQYISKDEDILAVYNTKRDKIVFTNKKLIIFDVKGIFGNTKTIQMFPNNRMCSSSIIFNKTTIYMLFTLMNGYKFRINFINLNSEKKGEIRKVYYKIYEYIDN